MSRKKNRGAKASKAKQKNPPITPTLQENSSQPLMPAKGKLANIFSSIKRFLIICLLSTFLFLFIQGIWLLRALIKDYLVFGFNPMYVFFRLPEVNIILSTVFFINFLIVGLIVYRIFRRSSTQGSGGRAVT